MSTPDTSGIRPYESTALSFLEEIDRLLESADGTTEKAYLAGLKLIGKANDKVLERMRLRVKFLSNPVTVDSVRNYLDEIDFALEKIDRKLTWALTTQKALIASGIYFLNTQAILKHLYETPKENYDKNVSELNQLRKVLLEPYAPKTEPTKTLANTHVVKLDRAA